MPAWRAGEILTCSLTEDQASVVQQVACLAPQQLVILWQVCSLGFALYGSLLEV